MLNTIGGNYSLFSGLACESPITPKNQKSLVERLIKISDYIDDFDIIVKRAKSHGINGEQVIVINGYDDKATRKLKLTIDRLLFMKANPQQAFVLDESADKLMVKHKGDWYYLMSSCDINGNPVWCKSSCQNINSYNPNLLAVQY